jgi:hypothetical protein
LRFSIFADCLPHSPGAAGGRYPAVGCMAIQGGYAWRYRIPQLYPRRYNTIDFANGGDIRGLIRAADAYLKVANDQTKIVPGHGALAKKADLVAWREMLVTSRDRIDTLVKEGKTEQEVLAAKPLHDLDAKWAANDQQAQNWTRMVYNSFKRS